MSLKRAMYKTAVPVLITASFGFAGAAFAGSGNMSNSGSMSHNQGATESGGSSSMSTSKWCKKNPTDPKCKSGMSGSGSGMSGSKSETSGGGSGMSSGKSGASGYG
ncbi:MAG: hypothetical protein ACRET1_08225, partial [Burkholderiales bacterium]